MKKTYGLALQQEAATADMPLEAKIMPAKKLLA